MLLEFKPVGPFALNTYLIACTETSKAAIIDSGGGTDWLSRIVEANQLEVVYLLQTHAHVDHVNGLAENKRRWPAAPIALHPGERTLYEGAPMQGMMFGMQIDTLPTPELQITDGQTFVVGELELRALHTPGHTPGHIVFYEQKEKVLFSGDLLFNGSIGRTDLPGGDYGVIMESLAQVAKLPRDVQVYSGHGAPTTIGDELQHNPFLRGLG